MVQRERILWWLTVATFLVPLIVLPGSFIFPFIVPKALVFRTLVLCQLGVFIVAYFSHQSKIRISTSPLTVAVGLFGVSFLLSTFLGTDWHHSFWDNHERMLGFFTVLHYVLYYLILTSVFKGKEVWERLLVYFLVAGGVVMTLGILQVLSPNFLLNNGNARVSATLGNAIYLGAYGLFLFFGGLYITTQGRKWASVVSVLGVAGILVSGTRGSVVGLLAGLGAMMIAYLVVLPAAQEKIKKILWVAALALVAVGGILFAFRTTEVVQKIPAVGSLLNTTLTGTANTRLMAWNIAIDIWQEKPWFGWGPNNFFYGFNKYYNPEFLKFGWTETWFDNAHNIVLNTLATQGILGVVSYLGIFVVAAFLLLRASLRNQISFHLAAIGCAFLAAHLVQNIFVFENITSYLYFMFFLALISALTEPDEKNVTGVPEQRAVLGTGGKYMVGAALFIVAFTTNWNAARANMSMITTLESAYSGGNLLAAYQKTASIPSPHQVDNRLDFARLIERAVPVYTEAKRITELRPLLALAISELDKSRAEHPYDIRVHIQESQLLQHSFELNRNIEDLLKAEEILLQAKAQSPNRQQVDFMLAGVELMLGKKQSAVDRLRITLTTSPTIGEAWWRLIYTLQQSGNAAEAKQLAEEARAKNINFDGLGESIVSPLAPKPSSTN